MKPLRIFSHAKIEHPGYLYEFLDSRDIDYVKVKVRSGDPIPEQLDDASGLIFLGAPVSVNDSISWIEEEIALIQKAEDIALPVLGICFGGQLICKALGAEVCTESSMQIGWHSTSLSDFASELFNVDDLPHSFYAFEWHGDTFTLPDGATPLFVGGCRKNQGFLYNNCLALQFHPEITHTMVHEWIEKYAHCVCEPSECVQTKEQILENIDEYLSHQQIVADAIFGWWLQQVEQYSQASL